MEGISLMALGKYMVTLVCDNLKVGASTPWSIKKYLSIDWVFELQEYKCTVRSLFMLAGPGLD